MTLTREQIEELRVRFQTLDGSRSMIDPLCDMALEHLVGGSKERPAEHESPVAPNEKDHIHSKDCWCNPEVEDYRQAPDKAPYTVAGYVGIPGEAMQRWLRAMKACGYVLTKIDEKNSIRIANGSISLRCKPEVIQLFVDRMVAVAIERALSRSTDSGGGQDLKITSEPNVPNAVVPAPPKEAEQ